MIKSFPNLHLAYPFSLTLRFPLTENVADVSLGEPHTPKNEFQHFFFFFFFFLCSSYTRCLRVNESGLFSYQ